MNPFLIAAGVIGFIVVLVAFAIFANVFNLWFQALISNARVAVIQIIGMRFRKVDARIIVLSRIRAAKAGLSISTDDLEAHYLAGGRVLNVVSAMIAANSARIPLEWQTATAIDLAGRDILDAVQTSVNPKVIDCPGSGSPRPTIDAVAKNGIQLKAKARVTVRTNIKRLVGGATEETIIARVGQGIVSTIGSADDHKHVLENPDEISKKVMASGLDAGTAFEILSIDIADIDVGDNIGAKLDIDKANAQKQMAQAEAEKRRSLAIAEQQEFKAQEQKNRATVVLAEAEVPRALAEALRSGRMGVMDNYRMQNLMADTSMRSSIATDMNPPSQQ